MPVVHGGDRTYLADTAIIHADIAELRAEHLRPPQSASKSVAATTSQPARSSPMSRPPAPENTETTLGGRSAGMSRSYGPRRSISETWHAQRQPATARSATATPRGLPPAKDAADPDRNGTHTVTGARIRRPLPLMQKPRLSGAFLQSGRQDLNLRPPGPQWGDGGHADPCAPISSGFSGVDLFSVALSLSPPMSPPGCGNTRFAVWTSSSAGAKCM